MAHQHTKGHLVRVYLIKINTKWSSTVWDFFVIEDADKSN